MLPFNFLLQKKNSTEFAARVLPLSTLVTPATLTGVSVKNNDTRLGQVPQLAFPLGGAWFDDSGYTWNQMPSVLLTRISMAAAFSMSILSMPPGVPNSTYVMDFNGPSFKCEEPNTDLRGALDQFAVSFEALQWEGSLYSIHSSVQLIL